MNGSEKQIKWAQDIIDAYIRANNRRLEDEQARYDADMAEEGEGDLARLECRRTIHGIVDSGLSKVGDSAKASDIIDFGVNIGKLLKDRESELMPHQAWITKRFSSMSAFLGWAI